MNKLDQANSDKCEQWRGFVKPCVVRKLWQKETNVMVGWFLDRIKLKCLAWDECSRGFLGCLAILVHFELIR